jgi:hypothetical protein
MDINIPGHIEVGYFTSKMPRRKNVERRDDAFLENPLLMVDVRGERGSGP